MKLLQFGDVVEPGDLTFELYRKAWDEMFTGIADWYCWAPTAFAVSGTNYRGTVLRNFHAYDVQDALNMRVENESLTWRTLPQ